MRYPDGTEIAPHLEMRRSFGLFAGVRPIKAYPHTRAPLADPRARDIDLVILRESTEGLFASRGRGTIEDDRKARDVMVITRATCERPFEFAFRLAERRQARGGKDWVTCVDKANVFTSMSLLPQGLRRARAPLFDGCGASGSARPRGRAGHGRAIGQAPFLQHAGHR